MIAPGTLDKVLNSIKDEAYAGQDEQIFDAVSKQIVDSKEFSGFVGEAFQHGIVALVLSLMVLGYRLHEQSVLEATLAA